MSQRQVSHTPHYFPNIQYLKCSRFRPEPLTRLRHFDSQVLQLLYNHSLQESDAFNAVNILHYHKCRYFLTLSLRLKEDGAIYYSGTAFKYLCYYFTVFFCKVPPCCRFEFLMQSLIGRSTAGSSIIS